MDGIGALKPYDLGPWIPRVPVWVARAAQRLQFVDELVGLESFLRHAHDGTSQPNGPLGWRN